MDYLMQEKILDAEILSSQTILYIKCPYCLKKMYLNIGDMNDITISNEDAIKCPYCEKISWLERPFFEEYIDTNDISFEKGQKIDD